MAFTQGDAYPIPIAIKQGDTVITPSIAQKVKIGIGNVVKTYPVGDLTFDAGLWYFPLSQEASYQMPSGKANIQGQITIDSNVIGTRMDATDALSTLFKNEQGTNATASPIAAPAAPCCPTPQNPIVLQIQTVKIGTKGGGTGGDKTFTYEQLTPSAEWRINHPLEKYPSVSVVDSGGSIVVGDVQYISESSIIVTFKAAFSGKAYLN